MVLTVALSIMSTLRAETLSHTETIRSGPERVVPYTVSENTKLIKFILKIDPNQKAVIQPPEKLPGSMAAPGWTPEETVILEDCVNQDPENPEEPSQPYLDDVEAENSEPSEAFVTRILGTVGTCGGEGANIATGIFRTGIASPGRISELVTSKP